MNNFSENMFGSKFSLICITSSITANASSGVVSLRTVAKFCLTDTTDSLFLDKYFIAQPK